MRKFRFRLERILNLRRVLETEQARVLRDLSLEEESCRRDYAASVADRERILSQVAPENGQPVAAGALVNSGMVLESADRRIEQCLDALAKAQQRAQVEARKYRGARRDRRVVEMMKDRQRDRWQTESVREEQKEFDEVAGRRASASTQEVE